MNEKSPIGLCSQRKEGGIHSVSHSFNLLFNQSVFTEVLHVLAPVLWAGTGTIVTGQVWRCLDGLADTFRIRGSGPIPSFLSSPHLP